MVKESYHDSYKSLFEEKVDESYVISKDTIWEVTTTMDSDPYDELFIVYPLSDGTYRYIAQYHNSCTCLWEILENNLSDLKDTVCTRRI